MQRHAAAGAQYGRGGSPPASRCLEGHFLFQSGDDLLFQPGDIGLGDAQEIGHLLLGQLVPAAQAKSHGNNGLFPLAQPVDGAAQHFPVGVVLHRAHDAVGLGAQNIGQQQLVSVAQKVEQKVAQKDWKKEEQKEKQKKEKQY